MKSIQSYFIIIIVTLSISSAYRILGVFPFNGKSHNIVFEAIMKGLAKHGHQVDVITHFPQKKPFKNYNDIINLDGTMEKLVNNYTIQMVSQLSSDPIDFIAINYGNRVCDLMGRKDMQKLIKNPPKGPPYDLVITETFGAHCYMGLGYVFKVPVVAVSSALEYPWVSDLIGNIDNLAIVPNAFQIGAGKMNYWQRLQNVISNFMAVRKFHAHTEEVQTDAMRKYLSPDIPNIREVEKNVALTLVNSHPIICGIKPITPSLVQIAGIHIEGNDEILSPELKKWMDESKHGVIYFTLGSMVLIETLPTEQLKEIFASFKKVSPVRVLIKIADSSKLPPGLPENIKVLPWTPQQPILAHPNTKLFITHGGLGGLEEALYYGVPMIGIPLFSDQFRNVEAFVHKEIMIRINLNELSETNLDSSLQALLHNPVYKEKTLHYSKLFRDQPISPMNNAIFWIEYVIRNGGHVLKSPAHEFSWWQLALLDIYGSIFLVLILSFVTVISSIALVIKKLTKTSSNNSKKKKTH